MKSNAEVLRVTIGKTEEIFSSANGMVASKNAATQQHKYPRRLSTEGVVENPKNAS